MEDAGVPRGPNGGDLRTEVVYPLLFPFDRVFRGHDGERRESVDRVTIVRPKGKTLKAIKHLPAADQDMALIPHCTGLSDKDFDQLDLVDIAAIAGVIGGFVQPGPPTGPTSSET